MMFEDEESNMFAWEIVPNRVCSLKFGDKTIGLTWTSCVERKHEMGLDIYKVAMSVIVEP